MKEFKPTEVPISTREETFIKAIQKSPDDVINKLVKIKEKSLKNENKVNELNIAITTLELTTQEKVIKDVWKDLNKYLDPNELNQLFKSEKHEKIVSAGKIVNELLDKRKATLQEKRDLTEDQFEMFFASLPDLPPKDLEKKLKSQGMLLERIDTLLHEKKVSAFQMSVFNSKDTTIKMLQNLIKIYEDKAPLTPQFDSHISALNESIADLKKIDTEGKDVNIEQKDIKSVWNRLEPLLTTDEAYALLDKTVISSKIDKLPEVLSLLHVKSALHEAYAKNKESLVHTTKQVLKTWAHKANAFNHDLLKFNFRSALITFGILTLTTVVTTTLAALVAAGVIACPPIIFALIGGLVTVTSVTLTVLGLAIMAYKKPNVFKTYINGEFLGFKIAQVNSALTRIYYSIIIDRLYHSAIAPLLSRKELPEVKENRVKTQKIYLEELERRVTERQKHLDLITLQDTSSALSLGTQKKDYALEQVLAQFKQFLKDDNQKNLLNLIDDREFQEFVQRHLGIDLEALITNSKGKDIGEAIINGLIKKIESFLIQDTSSLMTHVNVQMAKKPT